MSGCYDRDGHPVTIDQWIQAFKPDDRIVARTEIGETLVSTVWLGLDHGSGGGPPLIFETMTFPDDRGESEQVRYSTEEEALAGHAAIVARLRGEPPVPSVEEALVDPDLSDGEA